MFLVSSKCISKSSIIARASSGVFSQHFSSLDRKLPVVSSNGFTYSGAELEYNSTVVSEQLCTLKPYVIGPIKRTFVPEVDESAPGMVGHTVGLLHPASFDALCIARGVTQSGASLMHLPALSSNPGDELGTVRQWRHQLSSTQASLVLAHPGSLKALEKVTEVTQTPTIAAYGPRLRNTQDARLIDPLSGVFGNSLEAEYPEGSLKVPAAASGLKDSVSQVRVVSERANPMLPRSAAAVDALVKFLEKSKGKDLTDELVNEAKRRIGASTEIGFTSRDGLIVSRPVRIGSARRSLNRASRAQFFSTTDRVLVAIDDSEVAGLSLEVAEAAIQAGSHVHFVNVQAPEFAGAVFDVLMQGYSGLNDSVRSDTITRLVVSPGVLATLAHAAPSVRATARTTGQLETLAERAEDFEVIVEGRWSQSLLREIEELPEATVTVDNAHSFVQNIFGSHAKTRFVASLAEASPLFVGETQGDAPISELSSALLSESTEGEAPLVVFKGQQGNQLLVRAFPSGCEGDYDPTTPRDRLVSVFSHVEPTGETDEASGMPIYEQHFPLGEGTDALFVHSDLQVDPETYRLLGSAAVNPIDGESEEPIEGALERLKRFRSPTEMSYMPEGFLKKVPITTFEWSNFHQPKRFWKRGLKG